MFGLAVLAVAGLYLLVSVVAVKAAISHARKSGKSAKRWGWSAALVMYLIPFWDWLPTVAVHQYYCATEAGFWVYKTPEQWKKENPGVMETLVANKGSPSTDRQYDDGHGRFSAYHMNERFDWEIEQTDITRVLSIIRQERELKDLTKDQVLARYIDFGTGSSVKNTIGPPGSLRFWLHSSSCINGRDKAIQFVKFIDQFRGEKK